jgi:hypothetical protein
MQKDPVPAEAEKQTQGKNYSLKAEGAAFFGKLTEI